MHTGRGASTFTDNTVAVTQGVAGFVCDSRNLCKSVPDQISSD